MALKIWPFGSGLTSEDLNGNFSFVIAMINALIPVGKVMYFDDNNGANVVDSGYWAAMNGQTISDGDSAYDGVTLQDLSGRYIVGYGEDGDGNIASASWSAAAVGNAGNQVALVNHSHSSGTLVAEIGMLNGFDRTYANRVSASSWNFNVISRDEIVENSSGVSLTSGVGIQGSTSSTVSAIQSIQPRSIKMRAYLRFK